MDYRMVDLKKRSIINFSFGKSNIYDHKKEGNFPLEAYSMTEFYGLLQVKLLQYMTKMAQLKKYLDLIRVRGCKRGQRSKGGRQ